VPARSRTVLTSPIGHPIYVTIAPRGLIENLRFPATHLDVKTHLAVITADRHQQQDSSGLTIERCYARTVLCQWHTQGTSRGETESPEHSRRDPKRLFFVAMAGLCGG
jgi:hypothetical protein